MKKRILTAIILMIVFSFAFTAALTAAEEYGLYFEDIDKVSYVGTMDLPVTFEATVELPKGFEGRGGVILGNYSDGKGACINLEIHEGGRPRLYINDGQKTHDLVFKSADVRRDKPVHIAITIERTKKSVSLYVDGVFVQSISDEIPTGLDTGVQLRLGGDFRTGNTQNFKGKIYGVALWSDVRTALEINADMKSISGDAEGLASAWDMSTIPTGEYVGKIIDIGPRRRNFLYRDESGWIRDGGYKGSYAYSFAVIGDTQKVTYLYPEKLGKLYDWIIDNAKEKNTVFAIGLGDITDRNTEAEWATAKAAITKMDGIVPYSLVRGNHDGKKEYKETFPIIEYRRRLSGVYDASMLNTYQTFTVGNIQYLVLNLDFAYNETQLEWANEVISSHPEHNVIVTTHIYLVDPDNLQIGKEAAKKYGSILEPVDVWDKVISKHKNVVMVICGHSPADGIGLLTKKGDNGNSVKQLLIDGQGLDLQDGGAGMVAMFYFSEDGRKVNVEYYSTIKKKYKEGGSLSFMLDVIMPEGVTPSAFAGAETTTADIGTTAPDTTSPGTAAPADTSETAGGEDTTAQNPENGTWNNTTAIIVIAAAAVVAVVVIAAVVAGKKKKE